MINAQPIHLLFSKTHRNIPKLRIQELIDLVPATYRKKVESHSRRHYQAVRESLVGLMLLSEGFKIFDIPREKLKELKKDKNGKPYIDHSIAFNISHSYGIAICGFSPNGPLGIDIEKIKPIGLKDYKDILPRHIYKRSSEDISCFYRFWTKYESALKADGRGLSLSPDELRWNGCQAIISNRRWYVKDIDVDCQYKCHIATMKKVGKISCREIQF